MGIGFMNMDGAAPKSSQSRCLVGWAIVSILVIIGLVIGLIVTKNELAQGTLQVQVVRWCTVSPAEMNKCSLMQKTMLSAQVQPVLQCIPRAGVDDCVSAIESGSADAMTTDGGHMFMHRDKLKPVMAEDYGEGDATYWAVAVVKKSDTSTSFTSAGLTGKTSCHTGINKTAGWVMPVGALKTKGIITGCDAAASISSLFGSVCAPGGGADLCSACKGSCKRNCDNEDYCGYSGAFRCLTEGSGDVAFVKHTTVRDNTDGLNTNEWASLLVSSDYELLCTDGSRAPTSAYRTCNLGKVPSHSVVVGKTASDEIATRVTQLLEVAQLRYGPHTDGDFQLFSGSSPDLLFKSSTQQLLPLKTACTIEAMLGQEYINAQASIQCTDQIDVPNSRSCLLPQHVDSMESRIRWCVVSTEEKTKCELIGSRITAMDSDVTVVCLLAENVDACALLISRGSADVTTMDGGELYNAGINHGLLPIVTEHYGGGSIPSYYAVAAIRANDTTTKFTKEGLKGKRTCHTGYQKTAGWNVPVGLMSRNEFFIGTRCNLPLGLASFVNSSCVPGIESSEPGVITQLCLNCRGDCTKNSPYSGYTGAFNCLNNGDGDVAFIKHTTISVTERQHFMLLCPNGTIAPPEDYLTCHLAQVPPHALVTSQHHSFEYNDKVWYLLNQIQSSNDNILFTSPTGSNDLIFKDSTQSLCKVPINCSWRRFLGQEYATAVDGIQCSQATHAPVTSCNYGDTCPGSK
uniref:Serotransferrin-1 n=1 Tax=Phallusia mammillata TaxID=59560 RepID=A0A6F9DJV8_9ASCI|nr:serotransferrin-1 [Phallusia mammillata]